MHPFVPLAFSLCMYMLILYPSVTIRQLSQHISEQKLNYWLFLRIDYLSATWNVLNLSNKTSKFCAVVNY